MTKTDTANAVIALLEDPAIAAVYRKAVAENDVEAVQDLVEMLSEECNLDVSECDFSILMTK